MKKKKKHVLTPHEQRLVTERMILGWREIRVKAHTRTDYTRRAGQQLKDKTIDDFAIKFCAQLERSGVTKADVKHINKLMVLLEDTIADVGRKEWG